MTVGELRKSLEGVADDVSIIDAKATRIIMQDAMEKERKRCINCFGSSPEPDLARRLDVIYHRVRNGFPA